MTIVYLYTALCTVGGADRSIIQKANYLADEMHHRMYLSLPTHRKNGLPFSQYPPESGTLT